MTPDNKNDMLLGVIKGKLDMLIDNTKDFHNSTSQKIDSLGRKVARLEIKSGIWGAIAGAATSVVVLVALMWRQILGMDK